MAHLTLQLGAALVTPVSRGRRIGNDIATVRLRALRQAGLPTPSREAGGQREPVPRLRAEPAIAVYVGGIQ